MSGRSLHELRDRLEQRILSADEYAALCEFAAARAAEADRPCATAMITCLPPDESGVALFSLRHVSAYGGNLDVFSPVRDVAEFLANACRIHEATAGAVRLHPITGFIASNLKRRYRHVVYVIANSNHNAETVRLLLRMGADHHGARALAYVHDPNCLNVVTRARDLNGPELRDYVEQLYDCRLELRRGRRIEPWQVHAAALDRGVFGLRTLYEAGIRHFLVNSAAAGQILERDLGKARFNVERVFHPVFAPLVSMDRTRRDHTLTVGSFGVPGNSKLTRVVIDAVAQVRSDGLEARLLICGFDAQSFARREFAGEPPAWIEVDEPATERHFQRQLARCDVAVQLREKNHGESSGVVPTLIGLGIPTIVTPKGAFAEYGAAAVQLPDPSPRALARLLAEPKAWPDPDAMRQYAEAHTLERFSEAFRQAVVRSAEISIEEAP